MHLILINHRRKKKTLHHLIQPTSKQITITNEFITKKNINIEKSHDLYKAHHASILSNI